ncbi:MAG: sigma-70 family RNA polymerase sigma factor [Acidimicrobiia bacterium]|nr:sigma-70 family RNA polymerase sigma factor [Acidimicrobiia bacterium]
MVRRGGEHESIGGRVAAAARPTGRHRVGRAGAPDATLVGRLRTGDRRAFDQLYARHASAVRLAVSDHVDEPEEQRDCVQEAFTRALERLDSLRDPSRFRPWLLQIARNTAVDVLRRRQRFNPMSLDVDEAPAPACPAPGPPELAEVSELARRIEGAALLLSRRDATALSLAVHFGFGADELAVALGVSRGNAKVILYRARNRLRAAVELERSDIVRSAA